MIYFSNPDSNVDYKKQGKANRAKGARFEIKTRKHFENEGWIVTKWQNNIDLQTDEIIKAKQKFIGGRGMGLGSGFPDFLMFRKFKDYEIIMFVECKTNGTLSKIEKQKLQVLKEKGFKSYIAYLEDREVKLKEFPGYESK